MRGHVYLPLRSAIDSNNPCTQLSHVSCRRRRRRRIRQVAVGGHPQPLHTLKPAADCQHLQLGDDVQ